MRVAALCISLLVSLLFAGRSLAASAFFIRGGGDGHGIGMSQYGAYGYALHGTSYRFILSHYYKRTRLGETDPARVVRVLLKTGSAAFSGAAQAGNKQLGPARSYSVRALADGSLELLDQTGKSLGRFRAPLVVTGHGPLTVAGLGSYRGALELRPDGAGGVQTVEDVGLDDYVRGVISAEIPASWSPEALKAQAVAARTYAITTDAGGSTFDVYPDTRSQMYRGIAAETHSTDAAVAATRGQIVLYHGAPAVTYFFASSGGHTENVENVWPGASPKPWLRGVPDPYDTAGGDPYHRWGYDMSTAAAAQRLGALVRGRLIGIRVTRHGSSPRVLTAEVVGTRGRTSVSGVELQHTFGLMTTYAAFTTIASVPGAQATPARPLASRVTPLGAQAVVALVPLVHELLLGTRALQGTVFPAAKGATVAIQQRMRHGWHTLAHVRLGSGGSYMAPLLRAGSYRVLYRGLAGPTVAVR